MLYHAYLGYFFFTIFWLDFLQFCSKQFCKNISESVAVVVMFVCFPTVLSFSIMFQGRLFYSLAKFSSEVTSDTFCFHASGR